MADYTPHRKLLTRKEAAQRLGLSENTLAKWDSAPESGLSFFLIGKRARYDAKELDQFIESHRRVKAMDERRNDK